MLTRFATVSLALVMGAARASAPNAEAPAPRQEPPAKAPAAPPAEKPAEKPASTPAAPTTPAMTIEDAKITPAVASKAWVRMTTSKGDIVIELDREKAPISVENFLAYVKKGQYDGTVFHRVMKDFMIQGGGFDASMRQKPTAAPIRNEASNGLSNRRGTIAMARTNAPDSATAQFFINVVDNDRILDRNPRSAGYAVFGRVVNGMEVVDAIRVMPTRRNAVGEQSDPVELVQIIKAVEVPAPAAN